MGAAALPFETTNDHGHGGNITKCPVFRMFPKELRTTAKSQPHLAEYLHLLPVEKIGVPEYHETLNRGMSNKEGGTNVIYPVGNGIFIHIFPDLSDARDYYIAVEPGMTLDLSPVIDEVETRLVDYVGDMDENDADSDKRAQLLLNSVEKICTATKKVPKPPKNGERKGELPQSGGKLALFPSELKALRYQIVRDKEGMGLLDPLIRDPYIEDISCSGTGFLFVEHKIFKGLKSSISFGSMEELDTFVIRMSEKIGKPVTFRDPIVDATLPDGSRINIVFGGDLSRRGSNFTIRKFMASPLSILQLVSFNTLSYEMAAYLSLVLGHGMNMFVSGETASGKTTLMNALTTFIEPAAKIVSIEDTPELQVPHPNWIREVTRGSTKSASQSAVTMFDLLKAALRQRPNEIIIGEIRGEEGAIAFQAMQTGHAAMATFHAASVEKLIQRLTGNPINIPKNYIENLNVVAIQSMVRLPDGKEGRRVMSINEIVGYDSSSDSFSFIEVFRWNPTQDVFEFSGYMNSYLLEEKIAMMRGIPPTKKRTIYDELNRRATILRKLHTQQKSKPVDDFYELYKVLAQAYRQGIFR